MHGNRTVFRPWDVPAPSDGKLACLPGLARSFGLKRLHWKELTSPFS